MNERFGQQVLVRALTMRVIGYTDDGTERYKIPQANDVPWFDSVAESWPGDPVDLEWNPPKGGPTSRFLLEPSPNGRPYIRYRRLRLSAPLPGVLIGVRRRHEGTLDAKEPGQWVPGGSMVGPKRTLHLHVVALHPIVSKELIVNAHPQDIVPLGDEPVTATRTVAPKGRLGGR